MNELSGYVLQGSWPKMCHGLRIYDGAIDGAREVPRTVSSGMDMEISKQLQSQSVDYLGVSQYSSMVVVVGLSQVDTVKY